MVYIATISRLAKITIYPPQKAQIIFYKIKKIIIPFQYFDYINIFFFNYIKKLFKYIDINNYLYNLEILWSKLYNKVYIIETTL